VEPVEWGDWDMEEEARQSSSVDTADEVSSPTIAGNWLQACYCAVSSQLDVRCVLFTWPTLICAPFTVPLDLLASTVLCRAIESPR
jgi:hypothetical protein